MHHITIPLLHLTATQQLAQRMASHLEIGDVVTLQGELGVGKTTFSAALVKSLGCKEEVLSPTFTLVQTYSTQKGMIWHFDLYRLKFAQEITEIGLDDALDEGITLIEWPEMAEDLLPAERLIIQLSFDMGERRLAHLSGSGKWAEILTEYENRYR